MNAKLLISARPGETRAALVEAGQLIWYDFIRTLHETPPALPIGTVCLGRVRNIEPGLQAAFIDLGSGEGALLTARDARILAREEGAKPPIEKLVHEGEAILVQISRPGRDGKGPRVTADPALPSASGETVHPGRGGETPLWAQIREHAKSATAPALLWRPPEPDPAVALWRAAPVRATVIEVDHERPAAALRRALAAAGGEAEITSRRNDVFCLHDLDEEAARLTNSAIALPGGGSVIIEPAAALTAIDVNARAALGSTTEDTALKVNLEAAREIPRQIALRRLGGIAVVDFLRLKAARHRREIIGTLKEGFRTYRIGATVSGFSAAGLVEIVVPRKGTPLHERLMTSCAHCGGRGHVPDIARQALDVLARIVREAQHGAAPALEVHAAPEIVAWLDSHTDDVARELERFAVINVSWRAEPDWAADRMEVRRQPF